VILLGTEVLIQEQPQLVVLQTHVALELIQVTQRPEELLGLTRTEPTEPVEAQELRQDIAHLQEALAGIIQVRILQALQDRAAGLQFQEPQRTEALVIAALEVETVIQLANLQEVQVAGLIEVLAVALEVILVARTEVLVAVVLEVLVHRQEAQAVDLLDLLVRRHLAEVMVEIIKFNNFLKFKILL